MKIQAINSIYYQNKNTLQNNKSTTNIINTNSKLPTYSYRDFNINFKARLNRTPENFYSQKFNQENMPLTVKNYLYENFEERQHMPPAQLQREAFQYISIADTVEEVKEMYPNEPLFQNLRSFKDTKAKRGTLLMLRWDAQISGTPVFKDKNAPKDLAIYLLRKVYLEGKTLEEINKDFGKDATEEILKEIKIKDGNYFSYADLKSMGIKYPNISYYKSFLATRNDKEYIPATRAYSERTITEETKEKLSLAKKEWWKNLGYSERQKQIKRMLEGKELNDSTFSKFQWQIMTIAASKINYSDKLSQIFADKLSDKDFNDEFSNFAEKQRIIMKEFWNNDPNFKKEFSLAIHETITEFENALNNSESSQYIEELTNRAIDLKSKVIENAKKRKQQKIEEKKIKEEQKAQEPKQFQYNYNPKPDNKGQIIDFDYSSIDSLKKEFKKVSKKQTKYFPAEFGKILTDYILNSKDMTKAVLQGFTLIESGLINYVHDLSEEDKEFLRSTTESQFMKINNEFDDKYQTIMRAAEFAMNQTLFDITKDPDVFKNTRGDSVFYIINNNLEDKYLAQKHILEKRYKDYSTGLTDNNTEKFFKDVFYPELRKVYKTGFKYHNDVQHEAVTKILNNVFLSKQLGNKFETKFIFDFLKSYKGAARFIADKKQDAYARNLVTEHVIYDYICARAKIAQKNMQN